MDYRDARITKIDLKIRDLKEKQQQYYNELGPSAFSHPTYINLQSQINALESEKMGLNLGINNDRAREADKQKASRGSSVLGSITPELMNSMAQAQRRFHKMSKLKTTMAIVTGQKRKFDKIAKNVKEGKMSVEEGIRQANGMFR